MTSFARLGIGARLDSALAREGITDPFPIQELSLPDALAGRDVCGKARTGSGKTLAFGLALLERTPTGSAPKRPRALVMAPTRELARQIVDVLKPLAKAVDLRVAPFYGGVGLDGQINALNKGVDIAVVTPGRMIDLLERKAVLLDDIERVVIDEADRMADMGFLPQVTWIMRRLGGRDVQTMLFSATLDGQVDSLVRSYLRDPVRHDVAGEEPTVAEMQHRFFAVHQMDRVRVVAAIASHVERTIVFVRTKRGADRLVTQLRKEGAKAGAIHGDLRQGMREKSLQSFAEGKLPILVATDVAARGIHIDDIDVVLHFDPPEDGKGYLHRSGRTARAGRTGVVVTFQLWDQAFAVDRLKRALGLTEPVVEIFSNDPRLADLASFEAVAAS